MRGAAESLLSPGVAPRTAFTEVMIMLARHMIAPLERDAPLPDGPGDRFSGYAISGLPFRSGHVLALRRFPVSSIGSGYTAVWHRDPSGCWTFYSTVPPEVSCARYFGREVERYHTSARGSRTASDECPGSIAGADRYRDTWTQGRIRERRQSPSSTEAGRTHGATVPLL